MLVLPVLNWVIIEFLSLVHLVLNVIIVLAVFSLFVHEELVRVTLPDEFAEVTAPTLKLYVASFFMMTVQIFIDFVLGHVADITRE